MSRLLALLIAFVAFTGVIIVLPVQAEPLPEAVPVETSSDEVPMGSVQDPAPEADVVPDLTEAVAGVPREAEALRVTEEGANFSLVGVTWAYDPEVLDTVVQVRVRTDDGGWGEWTTMETETLDQGETTSTGTEQRGGTAPLWTGPSTAVEAELTTRSGATPTDVRLDLIDPGTSAADAAVGEAAEVQDQGQAAVAMPPVVTRAQWGADESLRTWAPQYAPTIKAATIHHTADSNDYTYEEVPAIMRSIYRYHAASLGWGDIGYNAIVDRFGRIFEGRSGGLASTVIGAHAGGFNTSTFGVSMLGNYDSVHPPAATLDAVVDIVAWKLSLFNVDPRGTVRLTSGGGGTAKYAAGQSVTLPTVFGHRDVGATACPGGDAYQHMDDIRNGVATRMSGSQVATIAGRYAADASARQQLGAAVGTEQSAGGVSWQEYQNGRIYSAPGAGVHVVAGDIWLRYKAGGAHAAFGVPLTDELSAADGAGRYNNFSNGLSIVWRQDLGAKLVMGAVRTEWERVGSLTGALGYPLGEETWGPTGAYQQFERGKVVYSPATGARELRGDILQRWESVGGMSSGVLPITGQLQAGEGVYNDFSNGVTIFASPATGTRLVVGAVRDEWGRLGAGAGVLGAPLTEEVPFPGGVTQQFRGGTAVYTPWTGAREVHGTVGSVWSALGGVAAGWIPTTSEQSTPDRAGRYNHFTNGSSIYWSMSTGAWSVGGAIRDRWAQMGWERSTLGYPTSHETALGNGVMRSSFQGGDVYWSAATGAQAVVGSINVTYRNLGAERSILGLPISGEYDWAGGRRTDFERGYITWTMRGTVTRMR